MRVRLGRCCGEGAKGGPWPALSAWPGDLELKARVYSHSLATMITAAPEVLR